MKTSIVALAAACFLARGALAQIPAAANPVGVWRGTSSCQERPSPCKDEVVVYRITRVNASDSLSLDGRKIVKGQEEEMGVLGCRFAASGAEVTCAIPSGVWRFTVRGDSLVGELRLPDNTKFRDVRTTRSVPALTLQLAAQQTSYGFPPKDTLRYHEVTEGRIELRPLRDTVVLNTRHDAKIALATERGDTVTAWYEELTLSSISPQGEWHPSTSAALHLPFRLVFTRAGQVKTISAPSFPAEIASHTELDRQFEDFFISLPKSALRPNVTWTDTVENTTSGSPQDTSHIQHIRHYRALRDTVLADQIKAIVIAVEQEITIRSSSPMKNAPVTIFTRLQGREEGTAVFTPVAGRLVSRVRRGHLDGEQVLRGQGREMTVPMSFEYSSSLVRRQ